MRITEFSVSSSVASYIDNISDELNRAVTTASVSTYVNQVRREIADGTLPVSATKAPGAYRFTWSQSSTSITLTTSVQTKAWPGDFIECITFFRVPDEKVLEKVDPVYFDQMLAADSSSSLSSTGTRHSFVDRGVT